MKKPKIISMWPASASRNWDGDTWYVQWDDRDGVEWVRQQSASKRFDGQRWCRTKAREQAIKDRQSGSDK